MKIKLLFAWSVLALFFTGCETSDTKVAGHKTYPYFGMLDRLDPGLDALISPDAHLEKLAEGFTWSEGPVWMKRGGFLVFSDVPQNVVHKWTERDGISDYLKPSGYTGSVPRGGEPGSNGLTVDSQGRLTLCEHGDRRVARLENDRTKTTLADRYEGKRFNSPNDLCYKSNGDLYFTDPPYGLLGDNHDVGKELSFQGVYRLSKSGQLTLLTDKLTFPNGLAFSPDEKILYVAVSDPKLPYIWAFDVQSDGTIANGRKFFDATKFVAQGLKGLPDGMKVDVRGNLFATGPGGVLIISPEGKHLGTISTGEPTANCAWGEDGSMLYITCNHWLARIQTRTRGKMP
jgi:gluconolactonase